MKINIVIYSKSHSLHKTVKLGKTAAETYREMNFLFCRSASIGHKWKTVGCIAIPRIFNFSMPA